MLQRLEIRLACRMEAYNSTVLKRLKTDTFALPHTNLDTVEFCLQFCARTGCSHSVATKALHTRQPRSCRERSPDASRLKLSSTRALCCCDSDVYTGQERDKVVPQRSQTGRLGSAAHAVPASTECIFVQADTCAAVRARNTAEAGTHQGCICSGCGCGDQRRTTTRRWQARSELWIFASTPDAAVHASFHTGESAPESRSRRIQTRRPRKRSACTPAAGRHISSGPDAPGRDGSPGPARR